MGILSFKLCIWIAISSKMNIFFHKKLYFFLSKKKHFSLHAQSVLTAEWSVEIAVTNAGLDEETANEAYAKIFVFGSQRLGVVNPNSDMVHPKAT